MPSRRRPKGRRRATPTSSSSKPNELVYDKDHNTVSAVGGVELYYKHRVLQADRVVYDRTTKRLYAEGRAKLTDEKGNVTYAKRFDLTDDFAAGFAEGVEFGQHRPHALHIAARRALGGRGDGFQQRRLHGLRTLQGPSGAAAALANPRRQDHREPADACRLLRGCVARGRRRAGRLRPVFLRARSDSDPAERSARPDLQSRQLHRRRRRHTVFSRPSAQLRSDADADLLSRRKVRSSTRNGASASRRDNTTSASTASFQQDPSLFPVYPYDSGDRRYRGSLESNGEFYLNDKWKWGWDITAMSDPFYLNDYKIKDVDPSQLLSAGRRVVGLSARPGGPRLLRSERLSLREHDRRRRPAPAAGRAPSSTTTRRSRFRPTRPAGSAARSRSTSTRQISRARKRPTSRQWPTRSTRPINSTMSAGQAARSSAATSNWGLTPHRRPPIRQPMIACCEASPAITRACPSRSRGSASSSTRSARPGRRSSSPGSTAR